MGRTSDFPEAGSENKGRYRKQLHLVCLRFEGRTLARRIAADSPVWKPGSNRWPPSGPAEPVPATNANLRGTRNTPFTLRSSGTTKVAHKRAWPMRPSYSGTKRTCQHEAMGGTADTRICDFHRRIVSGTTHRNDFAKPSGHKNAPLRLWFLKPALPGNVFRLGPAFTGRATATIGSNAKPLRQDVGHRLGLCLLGFGFVQTSFAAAAPAKCSQVDHEHCGPGFIKSACSVGERRYRSAAGYPKPAAAVLAKFPMGFSRRLR